MSEWAQEESFISKSAVDPENEALSKVEQIVQVRKTPIWNTIPANTHIYTAGYALRDKHISFIFTSFMYTAENIN